MKIGIYVISLKRAKERRIYIKKHLDALNLEYLIVDAVDGKLENENNLFLHANMERVRQSPYWLTKGAIACALSHKKVYDLFVESNYDFALVLEDDVVLPQNILSILNDTISVIGCDDVVLLYYAALRGATLSTSTTKNLNTGSLLFPMDMNEVSAATAYVIGKQAAKSIGESIIPVSAAADSWGYYYQKNCIHNLYVYYPMTVETKDFKSSIEYSPGTLQAKLSNIIDKYKIPILYQILRYKRKIFRKKITSQVYLTKDKSPYMK